MESDDRPATAKVCRAFGYQPENDMTRVTTFYIATNEEGSCCGDEDRQAAIDRLEAQYGGERITVSVLNVAVPRRADYIASITVREGIDDDNWIHRV
jgi:hypothetical protein